MRCDKPSFTTGSKISFGPGRLPNLLSFSCRCSLICDCLPCCEHGTTQTRHPSADYAIKRDSSHAVHRHGPGSHSISLLFVAHLVVQLIRLSSELHRAMQSEQMFSRDALYLGQSGAYGGSGKGHFGSTCWLSFPAENCPAHRTLENIQVTATIAAGPSEHNCFRRACRG